jgi:hypothetical protein
VVEKDIARVNSNIASASGPPCRHGDDDDDENFLIVCTVAAVEECLIALLGMNEVQLLQ